MKKILIALALCLMMVALTVTPALAGSQPGMGSQKVNLFKTDQDGNLTSNLAGFIVVNLKYPTLDDPTYTVRVNVSVKNLEPNTNYDIWCAVYGIWAEKKDVVTSGKGNAGTSFVFPKQAAQTYEVVVFVTTDGGSFGVPDDWIAKSNPVVEVIFK